jgi:drug/metabolite transporter (DMT)-like permease
MRHAPPMTSRDWALLVALSILRGGSFFFVGVAVREWPPLPIVLLRVATAAAALCSLVAALRLPVRRDRAALLAFLGMGVLNNAVPFGLIVWAQGSLPAGVASILNATTPLWSVLVAHAAGAERATPPRLAGTLLGVAGMVGADLAGGLSGQAPAAAAAMLLATFAYALAGLFDLRVRALGIPPLVAAAGQTTASTLLLLPPVLLLSPPWTLPLPSPAMAPRHALGMAGVAAGLALIDGRLVSRRRRRGAAA